jgi:hypothetical protein
VLPQDRHDLAGQRCPVGGGQQPGERRAQAGRALVIIRLACGALTGKPIGPGARHREPDLPRWHGQLRAERARRWRAAEHPGQPLP